MGILRMYFIYYPIFWIGYLAFKITRKTNWYAYVAFRRLFVLTRGRLNDRVNKQLSNSRPPYEMEEPNGVLGKLSRNQIDSIVEKIKENGFYIFDTKLDVEKVDELTKFARTAEAKLIPPSKGGITRAFYSAEKPLSPRYEFDEGDIMNHPIIQQLSVDSTFFAIAQMYLGAKPIQDLTAMWWSTAFAREASSEAAQLFHFDMDRFKFIKFFIYLTDVDTFNGPHCYIRGSHKTPLNFQILDTTISPNPIWQVFVTSSNITMRAIESIDIGQVNEELYEIEAVHVKMKELGGL